MYVFPHVLIKKLTRRKSLEREVKPAPLEAAHRPPSCLRAKRGLSDVDRSVELSVGLGQTDGWSDRPG